MPHGLSRNSGSKQETEMGDKLVIRTREDGTLFVPREETVVFMLCGFCKRKLYVPEVDYKAKAPNRCPYGCEAEHSGDDCNVGA